MVKDIRLRAIVSTLEHLHFLFENVAKYGIYGTYVYDVDDFFAVLLAYQVIGLFTFSEITNIMDYIYRHDYVGCVRYLGAMGGSCNA